MTGYLSEAHYGSGRPHGITEMATSLQKLIEDQPTWRHAALDIVDAFNHVSRTALAEAMYETEPALLRAQQHWVHGSTAVQAPAKSGENQWRELRHGIAQGDPLSSIAFSMVLEKAIRALKTWVIEQGLSPDCYRLHCYIDDVVLSATQEHHATVLAGWRQAIGQLGLQLSDKKMRIYEEGADSSALAEEYRLREDQCSSMGLVICGMALPHHVADDSWQQAIPVGNPAFQASFLDRKLELLQLRLTLMPTLADQLEYGGKHMMLHVLRASMLCIPIYMLQCLPLTLTRAWSQQIDRMVMRTFAELTGMMPEQIRDKRLVTHPLSCGGLGLHRLALEAPLIALAHHLSHRAARACQGLHNAEPTLMETQAWNQTMLLLSVPAALKSTELVLWEKGYGQAMKALRKQLYDELAEPVVSRPTQRLAATGGCCFALPGLQPPQQLALALAWWAYPRSNFVSDPVLQMTLRDRMELQTQQIQACQYTCRNSNRICGVHLDGEGMHPQQCCNGMILARHHSVRDLVHRWGTEAGWHSQLEQKVVTNYGPAVAEAEVAHGVAKRADIVFILPGGERQAVDVAITTSAFGGDAAADIERVEAWKRHSYGLRGDAQHTVVGERLWAFVCHVTAGRRTSCPHSDALISSCKGRASLADRGELPEICHVEKHDGRAPAHHHGPAVQSTASSRASGGVVPVRASDSSSETKRLIAVSREREREEQKPRLKGASLCICSQKIMTTMPNSVFLSGHEVGHGRGAERDVCKYLHSHVYVYGGEEKGKIVVL